jgi:hypothetical protein
MKHITVVAVGFTAGSIMLAAYGLGTSNGKLDLLRQQQEAERQTQEQLLAYELKASANEFSAGELNQIREAVRREVSRIRKGRVDAARGH